MKVLFINETCGRGSHGKICTSLADLICENGGECRIAYGRDTVPESYQKYALQIGNKNSVYFHALAVRFFDNAGFCSGLATKKFIQEIEAFSPDIIHLHNLHGYYLNIEVLFRYLSTYKGKIVWTLHDCWAFTGHCSCYDYVGCEKWKTECSNCAQKKCYPSSLLLDRSKANFRKKKGLFTAVQRMQLVTPSIWLKQQVSQSFLGKYPAEVIQSGIDLDIFHPTDGNFRRKYGLENKTVLLAVANVWSERKGIADYLRLAEVLDERYQLIMVGDLRDERIPNNVIRIAHTNSQSELAEIYTAADAYLNFSCEETQGLTTIEALACGTPVVVMNRTAIAESVSEDCGIALNESNPKALLEAIEQAKTLRADNCVRHAENFEKNRCFAKYLVLYEELLNDKL